MNADRDFVLSVRVGDRAFLRWFAMASDVIDLVRMPGRVADDVLFVDAGPLRIELSIHESQAERQRAIADCRERAEFALAPTRGAA